MNAPALLFKEFTNIFRFRLRYVCKLFVNELIYLKLNPLLIMFCSCVFVCRLAPTTWNVVSFLTYQHGIAKLENREKYDRLNFPHSWYKWCASRCFSSQCLLESLRTLLLYQWIGLNLSNTFHLLGIYAECVSSDQHLEKICKLLL